MLEIWKKIIPPREGIQFTATSRLCRLHFTEDCFSGQGTSRSRLRKDAVPTKFPEKIPKYLIKSTKKRKPPAERNATVHVPKLAKIASNNAPVAPEEESGGETAPSTNTASHSNLNAAAASQDDEPMEINCADEEDYHDNENDTPVLPYDFDQFLVNAPAMSLPPGWEVKIHMGGVICVSKIVFQEGIGFSTEKTVLFQKGVRTVLVINGRPIQPLNNSGTHLILTPDNIEEFVISLEANYKLCHGISKNNFAEECSGVLSNKSKRFRCHECKINFGKLSVQECRKRKRKGTKKRPQYTSLRMKMNTLKSSVIYKFMYSLCICYFKIVIKYYRVVSILYN